MKLRWLLVFVLVALLASAVPPASRGALGTTPAPAALSSAVATIVAGSALQARPISSDFWGLNVAASHPFTSADGALVAATPVTYLRFPGGTDGDRLNYTSGVIYAFSGSSGPAVTTVPQFIATCRAISCHAILELPAEINSPRTAAFYVNYVVNTLHFHPAFWEIGNEPAGWVHYNVPWSKWGSQAGGNATPVEYANLAHNYIAAIRSIDPTTPITALAAGQSGKYAKPWVESVAQVDGSELAGIAVHSYAAWSGPPSNPTLAGFFSNLQVNWKWALPNVLANGRQNILAGCPSCSSVKLFVDEINAAYGTGTYLNFASSFNGTLFIASEITQALVNHADSLEWFDYAGNFPGSWKEFGAPPGSQYFLFSDLFSHLGNETLPTTVSGPSSMFAAVTTDGTQVALLAVNVNVTNSVSLDLPQAGFAPSATLNEYLWPTGFAHPTESPVSVSGMPTLPPLSVAVFTGPAPSVHPSYYPVELSENGLPTGTSWSVSLNGISANGTGTSLAFSEPNGTYPFTVGSPAGYAASPSSGTVNVSGSSVSRPITFTSTSPPTYTVTFTESGLPSGTNWSVSVNGTGRNGTGSSLALSEPNGTYPFAVGWLEGYSVNPASGSLTVSGGSVSNPITFTTISSPTYAVTFTDVGLPLGTAWYLNVTGQGFVSSVSTSTRVDLPNGTYSFVIATSDKMYQPSPAGGTFTVAGATLTKSVSFSLVDYTVTFTESQLPSGAGWSVTLGGTPQSSTTSTITFTGPNGTYSFTVGAVSGYKPSPSSGSVTVSGSSITKGVTFEALSVPPGGGSNATVGIFGLPGVEGYAVLAGILGAAAVAVGVGVALQRRRARSRKERARKDSGNS